MRLLHLVVVEGSAGSDHDVLGLCFEFVDSIPPIQSRLCAGDVGVSPGACMLDGVQSRVMLMSC
jgi:hypothetical protein